jgi:hypothetical protein
VSEEVSGVSPRIDACDDVQALDGRNGRRGVLRQAPLLANSLLRSSSAVMFDMALPSVIEVHGP